jgi:hypothetical protein
MDFTEADEKRLRERYEGGMGGSRLQESADVLWLIEQVKKYQKMAREASRLMTAAAIERDAALKEFTAAMEAIGNTGESE